jgi:hypothetical protein
MYMYICLEFEGLFSQPTVPVLLHPAFSGSASEHGGFNDSIDFRHCSLESRGSNKHRGFEHRGSITHPFVNPGSNDRQGPKKHRGFTKHRGSEHRGSKKYHHLEYRSSYKHRDFSEHRGSTQSHTQHRVATRAKLQYSRRAYTFSSASLSIRISISISKRIIIIY